MSSRVEAPAVGLRERKKAKTRAALRQHALRLFCEQGYEATTVEQIAEAAEVSPSTFFRYFGAKEDVVLSDDYDPLFLAAFKAQPPEVSPITAMRRAVREVFGRLSAAQVAQERQRLDLVRSVPELRAAMLDEYTRNVQLIAEVVAERVGRRPDELAVRTFAGALVGVGMTAILDWAGDSGADYLETFDGALALLEAGLPL